MAHLHGSVAPAEGYKEFHVPHESNKLSSARASCCMNSLPRALRGGARDDFLDRAPKAYVGRELFFEFSFLLCVSFFIARGCMCVACVWTPPQPPESVA